jgi:hypothetical protein
VTILVVGTQGGLHELAGRGGARVVQLSGHEVTAFARDAEASWALTDGRELWRAEVGPAWSSITEISGPSGTCLCPSPSGLLVGTSEAHLHRFETHKPIPSWTASGPTAIDGFDRVDGREEWYTPWGGPPDVRSISRGDYGTIHANVHVGGIVRSRDDGASWEPTIDIHSDVHQVLAPAGHSGLVLAACARGLARSADGGDTWRFETEGLHAPYCRAVAVGDGTLYLSASRSHRDNQAALYRRPLEGEPFEKCSVGLPEWFSSNIDTACVAANGSDVAFGTDEGSVFVSGDSGGTWEVWASGLPPVRCVALA